MKRVLVVGMTANPGGIENVIMNYYRNINKNKIQFDFLCNTDSIAYGDEIIKLGGKIINVPSRSRNFLQYKKNIKKFFCKNSQNYSAIWVNFCNLTNLDYLKFAKKYGIKKRIIHSHNSQNMYSKLLELLHRINKIFVGRYATDFWACTDVAGKWFYTKKIYKENNVKIINNAIDLEKFKYNETTRNEYRKKIGIENKLVIGHVGRFHIQKNHEFLIDIFAEIYKKNKDVVLLLIGQGEEEEKIKQKVKDLKLSNNVYFLGARNDVPKIMMCFDLFLFPSLFEGLGLVLVEAQASGIHVIASSNNIPNEVKMTDNFEFVDIELGPKVWADIVLKNIRNKNQSKTNIKKIKENGYDIKTETEKLQKYFEEV